MGVAVGFLIWDNDAARWEPHVVSGDVAIDKDGDARVERIRGIEVHYGAGPSDQDVLTYDAGADAWVPQAPPGGGGGGGAAHSATHLTGVTGAGYSTVFDYTDTNGLVGAFYLYNGDFIDIQYKLVGRGHGRHHRNIGRSHPQRRYTRQRLIPVPPGNPLHRLVRADEAVQDRGTQLRIAGRGLLVVLGDAGDLSQHPSGVGNRTTRNCNTPVVFRTDNPNGWSERR